MKRWNDPENMTWPTSEDKDGISLRDFFAALALAGMNASPALLEVITGPDAGSGKHFDRLARKAYEQADAMMANRTAT